jgi:hypothetical protein
MVRRPKLFGLVLVAMIGCTPSARPADSSSAATSTPAESASSGEIGQPGSPSTDSCAAAAAGYSGHTIASFVTTIGAIRAMATLGIQPGRWPDLADAHPAVLCYVDGRIAKAPPPAASGTAPLTFDRAVVVVIDRESELIIAGYQEHLPIVVP